MSYAETRRVWDRFNELPFRCSPEALRAVVLEERASLALPPPEDTVPFTGTQTNDVLVFLCSDANGVLGLVRAPEALVTSQLRSDLEALHGRVFANAADLTDPLWDSALRVMAALALEMRDVSELACWGQDEGSSLTEAELEPLWNLWQQCDVRQWSQLVTCPAAVCALRRAM